MVAEGLLHRHPRERVPPAPPAAWMLPLRGRRWVAIEAREVGADIVRVRLSEAAGGELRRCFGERRQHEHRGGQSADPRQRRRPAHHARSPAS